MSERLGIPCLLAALAVLVVIGVLTWTGGLFALNIHAQRLMHRLGLDVLGSV